MRAGLALRGALGAALLSAALGLPAPGPAPARWVAAALAEEDWRAEFDALCGKTDDAMSLPAEELKALVARCDALAPRLARLDPPVRKVFSKRLQQCRDLFDFVLKSRARGS